MVITKSEDVTKQGFCKILWRKLSQEGLLLSLIWVLFEFVWVGVILGDPGADSGGEGKSKRAGKYGTKKSKEWQVGPLGTMSYQTSSQWLPSDWCQKTCIFSCILACFFFTRVFCGFFLWNLCAIWRISTQKTRMWLVLYKQLCKETNHRQLRYCMSKSNKLTVVHCKSRFSTQFQFLIPAWIENWESRTSYWESSWGSSLTRQKTKDSPDNFSIILHLDIQL